MEQCYLKYSAKSMESALLEIREGRMSNPNPNPKLLTPESSFKETYLEIMKYGIGVVS